MTREEIKAVLEKHKKWIEESDGWSAEDRADLSRVDLSGAVLCGANLSGAILSGTVLSGANLCGANLSEAYMSGADLSRADLSGANLCGANLSEAYLSGADLSRAGLSGANLCGAVLSGADMCRANLCGADLSEAYLSGANLYGAYLSVDTKIRLTIVCPDTGSFIAWKAVSSYIVKMEIPEDAKRSSATTRKCRCDKAKVLEIQNKDGSTADVSEVTSDRGGIYRVGEMVYSDSWDEDRWNECSNGIHFFVTRMEAEDWMRNKI